MLRDLRINVAFDGEERADVRAPVVPEICTRSGSVRAVALATLVDVLGGSLSARALYPDWMATVSLALHTSHRIVGGWVSGSGRVVRCGRSLTVIHVDIYGEETATETERIPAGTALMTFLRLAVDGSAPVDGSRDVSNQAIDFGLPDSGFDCHLLEKAGVRIADEEKGIVSLNMGSYVRNSIQGLQGGMVALLADVAGQKAASALLGRPVETCDLVLNYLDLGRVGPFKSRTKVIRCDGRSVLTRVEVLDAGMGDRLMAVVMNTGLPVDNPPG